MIKVSFCCVDTTLDVCKLLEENLTNHVEIEVWLEEQIRTVSFDCMDFPHDLDAYYDCYFQSEQEELDAQVDAYQKQQEQKQEAEVQPSPDSESDKPYFYYEFPFGFGN